MSLITKLLARLGFGRITRPPIIIKMSEDNDPSVVFLVRYKRNVPPKDRNEHDVVKEAERLAWAWAQKDVVRKLVDRSDLPRNSRLFARIGPDRVLVIETHNPPRAPEIAVGNIVLFRESDYMLFMLEGELRTDALSKPHQEDIYRQTVTRT